MNRRIIGSILVILGFFLPNANGSEADKERRDLDKDLIVVQTLIDSRNESQVKDSLNALKDKVDRSKLTPDVRLDVMNRALTSVVCSRIIVDSKPIRATVAKHAIGMLLTTGNDVIPKSEVLEKRLSLALYALPKTDEPKEEIVKYSLKIWSVLCTRMKQLSDYDIANPKVKVVMAEVPAAHKKGASFSGADPESISDPVFRKAYSDFLRQREEFSQKSWEYQKLSDLYGRFRPHLKELLKSASSDDVKREIVVGIVKKEVADQSIVKDLIGEIDSVPATQDAK